LALKAAGYAQAAAAELQKILTAHPNEVRAHLVLGNLCAEQLRDKARARVHYQRILELDSRHPQATAIRYWLVANPG
jgi:Flp pilus assembly protein TadD